MHTLCRILFNTLAMAEFKVPPLAQFVSRSNPSHRITYIQLNAGAPQSVLFCYGAGDDSATLTLYQEFIRVHPQLSLICVDRWTLPTSPDAVVSRSGFGLLSEFTSTTIELLDSLQVQKFSIAAHSAGAYPMLYMAKIIPDRVEHLFPICTHIPPPYNASWILSCLCSAPALLFNAITKLDSGGYTNPTIERLGKLVLGNSKDGPHDRDEFIDTPLLQDLLKEYRASPELSAAREERRSLDYQLVYSRMPDVDSKALADIYMSLKQHSIPVTWFTSNDDPFFGPASVRRLLDTIAKREGIEVVVVAKAKHSDIHFRNEVWNNIYERVMEEEK